MMKKRKKEMKEEEEKKTGKKKKKKSTLDLVQRNVVSNVTRHYIRYNGKWCWL
jgi:hypothetical protein